MELKASIITSFLLQKKKSKLTYPAVGTHSYPTTYHISEGFETRSLVLPKTISCYQQKCLFVYTYYMTWAVLSYMLGTTVGYHTSL